MCGLLAGSGKVNPNIIRALGCLNADRGKDSAGIGWSEKGTLQTAKIACNPTVAYTVHLSESIDIASKTGLIIGHTRQATMGEVNNKNAHPFVDQEIIFAHNGVIHNHIQFGEYDVDSEALIHGIKKRDFSEYTGPIAIVWIEKEKLFAFRNGNPLYRGLKDGALYLASQQNMLEKIECEKIRELVEGYLYTIAGGGIINSVMIPKNQTYQTVSQHSYNGFHSVPAELKPKPRNKALCWCNHKGKEHKSTNSYTKEWVCMAKVGKSGTLCPCNAFIHKNQPRQHNEGQLTLPAIDYNKRICECEHTVKIHVLRGVLLSCLSPECKCTDFKGKSPQPLLLPHVNRSLNEITTWEQYKNSQIDTASDFTNDELDYLPDETICDCDHEKEYHKKNSGKVMCEVSECQCEFFFPKDSSLIKGS